MKELKTLINPLLSLLIKYPVFKKKKKMVYNTFTNKSILILLFNANNLKNRVN